MRKKLPFVILAIIMFAQICVPVGLITYQKIDSNLAEAKGEKFRFYIDNLSYHPGPNNGILFFAVEERTPWELGCIYADIEVDEEGFAILNYSEKKPKGNYYIKSSEHKDFYFPIDEVKTNSYEHLYEMHFNKKYSDFYVSVPGIEKFYYEEAYLEAYVYKGRVGAPKVYIDGMEADEFLSLLNQNIQESKAFFS